MRYYENLGRPVWEEIRTKTISRKLTLRPATPRVHLSWMAIPTLWIEYLQTFVALAIKVKVEGDTGVTQPAGHRS